MLGMKVINVCSQISLGLKLSTSTMSFSTRVLPPLNKEQKMTLLLVLHPHHRQVLTRRFLLLFRAVSDTGRPGISKTSAACFGFLAQVLGLEIRLVSLLLCAPLG